MIPIVSLAVIRTLKNPIGECVIKMLTANIQCKYSISVLGQLLLISSAGVLSSLYIIKELQET